MIDGTGQRETCLACDGRELVATQLLGQRFSICRTCQCVFANPVPEDPSDAADVYLPAGFSLETAAREVEANKGRVRLIERFKRPGALLDVGSGPGYFVKAAQELGWRAAGCDLSTKCCEFGRTELGTAVYPCEFRALPEVSGVRSPDVITAFHVLEHLPSPREFVRFAADVLPWGGLAVVEIPNLFSFESLYQQESWHGLALPAHVAFYTPESLALLFGPRFRIVAVEYSVAECFNERVLPYLGRLAVDGALIDRCARQFSGTATVAYIEKRPPFWRPSLGRNLPYRAARKVVRLLRRRSPR